MGPMALVALVNLPFQGRIASVAQTSVAPPMGLAYLSAVLARAGHRVVLLDANVLGLALDRTAAYLCDLRPDVVGTTAATPSIAMADALGQRLAGRIDAPLVVGGPHTTALPLRTLDEFPHIDVAVVGEAEGTVDPLVRTLTEGGDLASIPAIAYRAAGGPTMTSPGARPDVDALPFPDRTRLPNHLYRTIDAQPMTCIIAMRGCPAGCTYCNVPALAGQRVRRRSPASVVAEMEQVLARWRVPYVSFLDDTFTTSRAWVVDLCDQIRAAGLQDRMSWSVLTRPDLVDPDLLATMKGAGLARIEMGIESGSPQVLERLGKGVTLEQIRAAFEDARSLDLVTLGFAMIGSPDESADDMKRTAREVMRIDPDFLQLSFCTPYPGTRLYDECRDRGLLATEDWSDYRFLRTPVIRHPNLSHEQLRATHAAILRRFYLRPRKALRYAHMAASRPAVARALASTSARALSHLARRGRG